MSDILLFSGGVDSTIAWFYLGKPRCLHITGHSRYSDKELNTVKKFRNRHPEMGLRKISMYWMRGLETEDAHIPNRNGYFVDAAAAYGDHIYLPCQKGEQSIPDRTPEFAADKSRYLSTQFERPITVDLVFSDWTKQDMTKWAKEHDLIDEVLNSYSCFSVEEGQCGACAACFRMAVALDYNNILPTTFFKRDIWKWDGIQGYIKRLKSGDYEKTREEQTCQVLRKHWFDI